MESDGVRIVLAFLGMLAFVGCWAFAAYASSYSLHFAANPLRRPPAASN